MFKNTYGDQQPNRSGTTVPVKLKKQLRTELQRFDHNMLTVSEKLWYKYWKKCCVGVFLATDQGIPSCDTCNRFEQVRCSLCDTCSQTLVHWTAVQEGCMVVVREGLRAGNVGRTQERSITGEVRLLPVPLLTVFICVHQTQQFLLDVDVRYEYYCNGARAGLFPEE